jgi:uncharacterized membrane protein
LPPDFSSGVAVADVRVVPASAERALDAARARVRLQSIDLLRGAVILLMALDHVRSFFTEARFDPLDPEETSLALYLTRWITHFCAPVFVLLTGTGAYLQSQRMSRGELSRFLATRGAWLVLLELTIVHFGWHFNLRFETGFLLQVIWAIGLSMLVLAALVHLRLAVIAAIGVALIAGHNLLDGIAPETFGSAAIVWNLLHVKAQTPHALVLYPLVPWIGVMAVGYALGRLYELDAAKRRSILTWIGLGAIALFVLLRGANLYGDPQPWRHGATVTLSLMSFLDVEKYPPSLAYVLVTIGPALLLLAHAETLGGRLVNLVVTFGRVPLFVYVAHIYVTHFAAGVLALAMGFGTGVLANLFLFLPDGWGFGLVSVYLAWLAVVAALYPAARWFAEVKRRRRDWWLAYL